MKQICINNPMSATIEVYPYTRSLLEAFAKDFKDSMVVLHVAKSKREAEEYSQHAGKEIEFVEGS